MRLRSSKKGKGLSPKTPPLDDFFKSGPDSSNPTSHASQEKIPYSKEFLNRQNEKYLKSVDEMSEIIGHIVEDNFGLADAVKKQGERINVLEREEIVRKFEREEISFLDNNAVDDLESKGELGPLLREIEKYVLMKIKQFCVGEKEGVGKGEEGGLKQDTYKLNPRDPITISHTDKTEELTRISKSAHIPDISGWININVKDWEKSNTYIYEIAGALRGRYNDFNMEYVENIYKLAPVKSKGKLRFPVNVEFKSSVARNKSFDEMEKCSKREKISPLIFHYSVNAFPNLKQNLRCVANILRDLKQDGKIAYYELNSFFAIPTNDKVGPLYSFRIPNSKSKTSYKDSYTNKLFMEGIVVDGGSNSENYNLIREAILDHICDEEQAESQPLYEVVNCEICKESDGCGFYMSDRIHERQDMDVDDCILKTPPWKKKATSPKQSKKKGKQNSSSPPHIENAHELLNSENKVLQRNQTPLNNSLNGTHYRGNNQSRTPPTNSEFRNFGGNLLMRNSLNLSYPTPSLTNFNTPSSHFNATNSGRQIILPPMMNPNTPRYIPSSYWRPLSASPQYLSL